MLSIRTVFVSAASAVALLAFASAARGSVYSNTVTDPEGLGASLVSYWQFEDSSVANGATIADSFGPHSGTAQGNLQNAPGVPGIGGNAITFDGASSITAAATGAYPSGNTSFTFTGWVKSTQDAGSNYPTIFETGTEQPQQNFSVIIPSNSDSNFNSSVTGELGASQHGNGVGGTTSITDGQWHFIAASYDGANYKLYVDGSTPQATKAMATNIVPATLKLGNGYNPFNGSLDEVAVFNKALSSSEIQSLVNAVPEPAFGLVIGCIGLIAASRFRQS